MAFVAAQNKVTFDGTETNQTGNVKVLQLLIKTILEAAEAEKTAHNRGSAYWFLDSTRASGGDYPSESGGADSAIYDLSSDSHGLGVFFKNTSGETAFITFSPNYSYQIGNSKATYGVYLNPIIGSDYYSDNMQIYSYERGSSNNYGLGLSISKTNFGGLTTPWASGFFSDGDLKLISDSNSSESSIYDNGKSLDFIVGIDGKKIFICRRTSDNNKRDCLLFYGDCIVPDDPADTEIDCIFSLQQIGSSDSYYNYNAMFRDKSGSTSFNPNGSDYRFCRKPWSTVNQVMINASNTNNIPYTGISFGWQSCVEQYPNTTLNANGKGYKGLSDTSVIKILTSSSIVQNKTVYNNNLFIISQFLGSNLKFSVAVAWDPNNITINQ